MQGIYTYISKTICVPSEYSVAAILLFLFMVHTSLSPVLNLLHFYIGNFRSITIIIIFIIIIIIIIIIVIIITIISSSNSSSSSISNSFSSNIGIVIISSQLILHLT